MSVLCVSVLCANVLYVLHCSKYFLIHHDPIIVILKLKDAKTVGCKCRTHLGSFILYQKIIFGRLISVSVS